MTVISQDQVENAAASIGRRSAGKSHVKVLGQTPCLYQYPNGEHCFVGEVFEALNLPLPSINSIVNKGGVIGLADWLKRTTGTELSSGAKTYLNRVQSLADQGYYWSDVVAKA